MSTIAQPVNDLSVYLECLKELFLERVAADDAASWQPKDDGVAYYYKWNATGRVAEKLGVTMPVARKNLHRLVSEGLALSKKEPNYILWSAKEIEGFIDLNEYYKKRG